MILCLQKNNFLFKIDILNRKCLQCNINKVYSEVSTILNINKVYSVLLTSHYWNVLTEEKKKNLFCISWLLSLSFNRNSNKAVSWKNKCSFLLPYQEGILLYWSLSHTKTKTIDYNKNKLFYKQSYNGSGLELPWLWPNQC